MLIEASIWDSHMRYVIGVRVCFCCLWKSFCVFWIAFEDAEVEGNKAVMMVFPGIIQRCKHRKLTMPKDKHNRHHSSERNRYHAYKRLSRSGDEQDGAKDEASENSFADREWEDVTCPICMEFPHNAVLLCCSSHEKGCRPYMCNTSYRHSNCLDQYHKAQQGVLKNHLSRESLPEIVHEAGRPYNGTRRTSHGSDSAVHYTAVNVAQENLGTEVAVSNSDLEVDAIEQFDPSSSCSRSDMMGLLCPLCRGKVKGWIVVQAARDHLNHKVRSCAQEACLFAGTYEELRLHARREHPFARPFEVDPDRQRNWSRLQRRRDLADVMSTVMPSATMLGDVMVDDDLEEDEFIDFPGDDGHFWTAFLLFQVFGPATSVMSESVHVRSRPSVPHRGLRRGQPVSNDTMQSDTVSDNNSPELSRSSRRHSRRAEG